MTFIRKQITGSRTKGIVVGISGGIDSAVTVSLCVRAIGANRIVGALLFEDAYTNSDDYRDAKMLARSLGIKSFDIPITPVVTDISKALESTAMTVSRLTLANIKARVRMTVLYSIANERNLLVAGTGDRSESLVGYFTKYGDGGADFLPIGHLYKTEVRSLGTALRLPYQILTKPSSPNLWPGQKAEHELPTDYNTLDRILTLLYDRKVTPRKVAERVGVSSSIVKKIVMLNKRSEHKRRLPTSLG